MDKDNKLLPSQQQLLDNNKVASTLMQVEPIKNKHEIEIPTFIEHHLIHYKQQSNWDCGLASILMVLSRSDRIKFLQQYQTICAEEGFGKSTWTIDLCYVLKRFQIKHTFLTETIGVNSNFSNHNYYSRILAKDYQRILMKFENAKSSGIVVEQRTVNNYYLLDHLANYGPIIVLTNSMLLLCDICKLNKLNNELRTCLPIPWTPTYLGHYIVLCGYNMKTQKYFYRNPVRKDHVCVISFDKMTDARTSSGTDEDIILIYSNKSKNSPVG